VWFDFSDQFLFVEDAFIDDRYTFNNAPQSMFVLDAPFDPGLGIITVHSIIELVAPNLFAERAFFQVAGVAGPDAMWQAVDCSGWNGIATGYCVNSGSQGGGDGIFHVDSDWTMTLVETINNCNYLGFDANGAFDGSGVPTLFYGTPDSAILHPSQEVIDGSAQPRLVLGDGRLAALLNEPGLERLALVDPGDGNVTVLRTEATPAVPIARQNAGALRIVTGDVSGLPGVLYVIVQAGTLYAYATDGSSMPLAATGAGQDWRWASAVIPESSHPLSVDGRPTFFILESNRTLDRDRVIWLQPPGP
jgi:hypothetical protein